MHKKRKKKNLKETVSNQPSNPIFRGMNENTQIKKRKERKEGRKETGWPRNEGNE